MLSHGAAASWPLFATVTRVSSKVATCILKYEAVLFSLLPTVKALYMQACVGRDSLCVLYQSCVIIVTRGA